MQNNLIQGFVLSLVVSSLLWGCATPDINANKQRLDDRKQEDIAHSQGCEFFEKGMASWYGNELLGNRTANGEMFVPNGITAAHKTLPFGTILKVTMDNGKGNPKGVFVRVNDRGPFVKGRIIDLSWGAAKQLGMMDTKPVHIYRCK